MTTKVHNEKEMREDEARGKALREYLEKTSRKTMTTTDTPNAAEPPSAEPVPGFLAKLSAYQEYVLKEIAFVAANGSLSGTAAFGLGSLYGELVRHYARELDSHRPAESVSAEPVAWQFLGTSVLDGPWPTPAWKECADPVEAKKAGFEVRPLYLRPQPSTPGAVSDEDVGHALDAFNRAVKPDHWRIFDKGGIRAALESFAKRSAEAKERDTTTVFLADVEAELRHARAKFPGDRIMTIALAEEFGELAKAVLDEPSAHVYKEAVQTAVMAARVVIDGDSSVNEWRAAKGLDGLTDASRSAAK